MRVSIFHRNLHLPKTSGGREVKLCCITISNQAQKAIIDRLGLTISSRLGRPVWVTQPQKSQTQM